MNNTSTSNTVLLHVGQLQPNRWNPNQMTDAQFKELVDEVRRLGHIPKPIVVRPDGDRYEIIDGEHNWRAAQDVGLAEVPCEIITADDFEAMLQTYKRNQHGQHSPVLEGRLFREMGNRTGAGYRELARAAGISEGTIRNRLLYAQAADMRNRYAGSNRDAEVDGLQIRQVRAYLDLGHPVGDTWLDAGGDLALLGKYRDHDLPYLCKLLDQHKLIEFLDPQDFRGSFERTVALATFIDDKHHVRRVVEYVRPIAQLRLPAPLAAAIPVAQSPDDRAVHIDLESWLEILDAVRDQPGTPDDLMMEVASAVYETLEDSDIDPRQVFGEPLAGHIETMLEVPDYIREARHLSLEERMKLHFADMPAPPLIIDQAKEETVVILAGERAAALVNGSQCPSDPGYVVRLFFERMGTLLNAGGYSFEPNCLDRERLLQSFDAILDWCPRLRDVTVAGRPAAELFCERIAELRTPELATVRALLGGAVPSEALGEWLDAVHSELTGQTTMNETAAV